MSLDQVHLQSPVRQPHELPVCTRSSDYQPAAPEQQSVVSQWVVKIEAGLMILVMLGLGARFYQTHREDRTPIKVAASRASTPLLTALPPGLESATESSGLDGADAGKGQVLYMQTCTACHGQNLQGMPHQGINLRESKFIATTNDRKLVAFIKMGRQPADPKNTTKLLMPPRGGNPSLDDDALAHIVAFLRQVQKEASPTPASLTPAQPTEAASAPSTRPVAAADQQPAGATVRN